MGKHKKNKPTPTAIEKEGTQDLIVDVSQIPNDEFKEEEKIVENLEDMPLGDIDPVERQLPDPEFEKPTEQKKAHKSFSDMLRERRKSFKTN